eukprot:g7140.t3
MFGGGGFGGFGGAQGGYGGSDLPLEATGNPAPSQGLAGFLNDAHPGQDAPSGGGVSGGKAVAHTLTPVTIRMLLDGVSDKRQSGNTIGPDEAIRVNGRELHMLTLVACAGISECREVKRLVSSGPEFQAGDYIRVHGHVRHWEQEYRITAARMSKIESINEISHHTVEVATVHLALTDKLVKAAGGKPGSAPQANNMRFQATPQAGQSLLPQSVHQNMQTMPQMMPQPQQMMQQQMMPRQEMQQQQMLPQQAQQGMPMQGMQQGMHQPGMPQQAIPHQGMPQQGMQQQGMPQQGMHQIGVPQQGMQQQAMQQPAMQPQTMHAMQPQQQQGGGYGGVPGPAGVAPAASPFSMTAFSDTSAPAPGGAGGCHFGGPYGNTPNPTDREDRCYEPTGEALERLLRRAERASGLSGGLGSFEQWREVLSSAKATLRRKPEDAVALRCAARALLSIDGDAREIREYARQAMEYGDEASGFTLGYELHAYLGKAAEGERNFATAEKHFSAALSSKAGDETAMLGLARVLSQRKEGKAQARKLYEQVVSSHPSSAEAHLRLAEFAQEADDAQEAYRIALQAVKVAPRDAAAHLSLGHASSKLGRADEAVRALEQVAVLQPSALDEAIRYYKRVLDSRPDDYECTLSLAQLHADRGPGGASQAVHYFRTALKCRPTTVDARSIYLQMATVQCAISAWKDCPTLQDGPIEKIRATQKGTIGAVHELPEDAEMWQKLLSICEQLKDSKGQHHCHRRLVQLGATTAASQIMYASLLMSEDRLREAKELLNQVIKAEPKNAAALLKLAQCLKQDITCLIEFELTIVNSIESSKASSELDGSRDGNLEEALRLFEQVLQLSPNNLEALEGAAYCNRKSNKLDQAVQLYQQCLKVNASAESPLYYLGLQLSQQSSMSSHIKPSPLRRHPLPATSTCRMPSLPVQASREQLWRGLQDGGFVPAAYDGIHLSFPESLFGCLRYLLAKSHISLDEHEEAEKQARSGLTLKPNHPHFLFILALVKNRMGDFDASITTLKKAFQHLGVDSDNLKVEIHDWLAQAYERKGEYTNASAELAMALKQDPSHVSSLITQGVIHMQLKKLEEDSTLAIVKNHALALVRLGYCKLLCADSQEAILLFQRALQQRCGTVALPRSVKGCARIYMALALMGKQDPDGALHQIAEARKKACVKSLIRNFDQLCSFGKDSIVKGQCDDLVDKLKSVPDLDITLAQAWQLVELLAKEIEVEVGLGDRGKTPTAGSTESPSGESQLQSQAQGATPERRAWVATPTPSTATPSSERRQWTSPSPATPAAAPPAVPKAEAADKGKKLLLHKHEMIDFNQLVQRDCLGSGGFGAVYRGYLGSREVAIKKLFCEDGGNISPLQLEELEKEVAALRSLNHPRLVSFIGACLQPPNICIVTEF